MSELKSDQRPNAKAAAVGATRQRRATRHVALSIAFRRQRHAAYFIAIDLFASSPHKTGWLAQEAVEHPKDQGSDSDPIGPKQ